VARLRDRRSVEVEANDISALTTDFSKAEAARKETANRNDRFFRKLMPVHCRSAFMPIVWLSREQRKAGCAIGKAESSHSVRRGFSRE
jgi:hypothetical protein